MSGLSFYALANAWLFALIVPLVLFYFLKLRRPRLQIPSLFLWRQVLMDKRVNSPFQRFKRNILLLLQLLLLVLLILAAMQPFWQGRARYAQRIPIMIDCSASMDALDEPNGTSRLEAARQQIGEMIDGMLPDQEFCLISFSRTARKLTDFTNNKRVLHEALGQIKIEDVSSDIEQALRVTQALSQSVPVQEVLLVSDGNLPERANFDLPFVLNYQRLPPAGPNFGITSLSARRRAEQGWDVFVLLEGSADAEGPLTVEVSLNGESIGVEHVSVTKGKPERMAFTVEGAGASSLEVSLTAAGFDSLARDNVAFLELPSSRPLSVYVSADLQSYRHVLSALTGVGLQSEDEALPGSAYDLVITDSAEDLSIGGTTCCYVGILPADLQDLLSIEEAGSSVVDWKRSSALLRHVELGDLLIAEQPRSAQDVTEGDYENLGYEVLIHGQRGPLLLKRQEGAKLLFYFLFHSDRSTLPYRVGFPVLVYNLVQVATSQAGLAEANGRRTGVLRGLVVRPDRQYEITSPDGATRVERSNPDGILSGIPAPQVGYYSISENGEPRGRVGASLLATDETTLGSVERIQFAEDLSVAASSGGPEVDKSLWPLFAMLAFYTLLGEWWYFNRNPVGRAE